MKADKQPQHFRVNKQRLRFTAIAALLFTLLIVAQFGCLIAAACIPRTDIQHNLEESSALLNRHEVFFYASASNPASRIDRYADSILMNIIFTMTRNIRLPRFSALLIIIRILKMRM